MIAVIDSGVANLASVMAALGRLGAAAEVTADASKIRAASRVILPGVGSAQAAMAQLKAKNLIDVIRGLTQPVLGICLGMQLLFEGSEEGQTAGQTLPCLGVIPGTVRRMQASPDMPARSSPVRHPRLLQHGLRVAERGRSSALCGRLCGLV